MNSFIATEEIVRLLNNKFDNQEVISEIDTLNPQPVLTVHAHFLVEFCTFLKEYPKLFFDFLNCITAIDNGKDAGTFEVLYHISSIPFEKNICLKVILPRDSFDKILPSLPSVNSIWRSADWHEREIFDLFGIHFSEHPDLRRILMPADWVGFPLRKDYEDDNTYHGIKIKYK